ncbi:MAG: hypothetical protein ACE5HP_11335 [Gemmatimonadota bacterium]
MGLAGIALGAGSLAAAPIGTGGPGTASPNGQASPLYRIVTSVVPDTVRVGEPFVLGVIVQGPAGTRVQFPLLLALGDELEQRGAAEVRQTARSGEWRAYYPLVAWRSGIWELPAIEVDLLAGEARRGLRGAVQPVVVGSVLPEEEGLELRGARPFVERFAFPWIWLLAFAALLAAYIGWRKWKGREAPPPVASRRPETAAERALRRLAALRASWIAGELSGARLFDDVETALRTYVEATRSWEPGRPLRQLPNGDRALSEALLRSALVRFARLGASREGPVRAIDACAAWIRETDSGEGR